MNDTLLRSLDTNLVPNSATLHVPSPAGGYVRGVFGVPIGGEGGIVSTVDDMLLWLKHMSDPVIGSRESWKTMRTPVASHGYGLGLTNDRHRGLTTVHHAGTVIGGSCQMLKVLDHELDIIVMSNGLGALDLHGLIDAIIDRCIPNLPPPPDNVPAAPVTGVFHSAETGRALALESIEGKQAVRIGGMTLPALRDIDGGLSVTMILTDLRVTPQLDGRALEIREFGKTDILRRVEASKNVELGPLVGRYENAAAGIAAAIERDDAGAALLTLSNSLGAMDYTLTAIGPALWEGRATSPLPLAVLLEVKDNGFLLTTGRTLRLSFERRS
jgi:hypothetical protein